jgi:hypothetical protein
MNVASRLNARETRIKELCRGLSIEKDNARTTTDIPFWFRERRDYIDRLTEAIRALEAARQLLVGVRERRQSEGTGNQRA